MLVHASQCSYARSEIYACYCLEGWAVSCILAVLNTLLVLHEIGQPHLELSPANIMLSKAGKRG